jgi:hypothetical protein
VLRPAGGGRVLAHPLARSVPAAPPGGHGQQAGPAAATASRQAAHGATEGDQRGREAAAEDRVHTTLPLWLSCSPGRVGVVTVLWVLVPPRVGPLSGAGPQQGRHVHPLRRQLGVQLGLEGRQGLETHTHTRGQTVRPRRSAAPPLGWHSCILPSGVAKGRTRQAMLRCAAMIDRTSGPFMERRGAGSHLGCSNALRRRDLHPI